MNIKLPYIGGGLGLVASVIFIFPSIFNENYVRLIIGILTAILGSTWIGIGILDDIKDRLKSYLNLKEANKK